MPAFPLASPETYGVTSIVWNAEDTTARARNQWTQSLITQVFDGRMWSGTLTIRPHRDTATARAFTAWLAALRRTGTNAGTFLLGHPGRSQPLGSAKDTPGTPVVNGAGQTGEALNVSGLPTSTTGYLLAGDLIQLGTGITSRLLMVLDDVDSDGGGLATINTWPGIRTAPANGATVTVANAQGIFISPGSSSWRTGPPTILSGVSIDVAEVVP